MSSFRHWLRNEILKRWRWKDEPHWPTMEVTLEATRYRAEERARDALVHALGAEELYHTSAYYRAAIENVTRTVVAGVFGEFPLTKEEKKAKLDLFHGMLDGPQSAWDAAMKAGIDPSWTPHTSQTQSKPVTLKDVQAALKGMDPAPGPPHIGQVIKEGANFYKVWNGNCWIHCTSEEWAQTVSAYGQSDEKPSPYGTVVLGGRKAGKSGLPAATANREAEEAALAKLAAQVEQKSDELLGIKQKAKYEELVGVDPEDI